MNKDYICTQLRIVIGEESLFGLFQSLDTWYNERYVILYPELYAVKPDWVNNILTGNWFGYAQEIPALKLRIEKLNEMINQVIPLIHV
jgi:hypothetical protein